MSNIDQLYATHCTYGTAAAVRKTGAAAKDVRGFDARASTRSQAEVGSLFKTVEGLLYYYLPKDAPRELSPHQAPKRLFYRPSVSGQQVVGKICYRERDVAGRLGAYFAHLLAGPATERWDVLDCLRLWTANWVEEDGDHIKHDIDAKLTAIDELPGAKSRESFDAVLQQLLGISASSSPPLPPGQFAPPRWSATTPEDLRKLFRNAFRAFFEQQGRRTNCSLVLVAEPAAAVLIFYLIARLLPAGPIREVISFSTYEDKPRDITLVATTLYDQSNGADVDPAWYARDVVVNTFQPDRSTKLPDKVPAYVDLIWNCLFPTNGQPADNATYVQDRWKAAIDLVDAFAVAKNIHELEALAGKAYLESESILDPNSGYNFDNWSPETVVRAFEARRIRNALREPNSARLDKYRAEKAQGNLKAILSLIASQEDCSKPTAYLIDRLSDEMCRWLLQNVRDCLPKHQSLAFNRSVGSLPPEQILAYLSNESYSADIRALAPVKLLAKLPHSDVEKFYASPAVPPQCKENALEPLIKGFPATAKFAISFLNRRFVGDEWKTKAVRPLAERLPDDEMLPLLTSNIANKYKEAVPESELKRIPAKDILPFLKSTAPAACIATALPALTEKVSLEDLADFLPLKNIDERYKVQLSRRLMSQLPADRFIPVMQDALIPASCKAIFLPHIIAKLRQSDFFQFLKLPLIVNAFEQTHKNEASQRLQSGLDPKSFLSILTDESIPAPDRRFLLQHIISNLPLAGVLPFLKLRVDEVATEVDKKKVAVRVPQVIQPDRFLEFLENAEIPTSCKRIVLPHIKENLRPIDLIPFLKLPDEVVSSSEKDEDAKKLYKSGIKPDMFIAVLAALEIPQSTKNLLVEQHFIKNLRLVDVEQFLGLDVVESTHKQVAMESLAERIPADQLLTLLENSRIPDQFRTQAVANAAPRIPRAGIVRFLALPFVDQSYKTTAFAKYSNDFSHEDIIEMLAIQHLPTNCRKTLLTLIEKFPADEKWRIVELDNIDIEVKRRVWNAEHVKPEQVISVLKNQKIPSELRTESLDVFESKLLQLQACDYLAEYLELEIVLTPRKEAYLRQRIGDIDAMLAVKCLKSRRIPPECQGVIWPLLVQRLADESQAADVLRDPSVSRECKSYISNQFIFEGEILASLLDAPHIDPREKETIFVACVNWMENLPLQCESLWTEELQPPKKNWPPRLMAALFRELDDDSLLKIGRIGVSKAKKDPKVRASLTLSMLAGDPKRCEAQIAKFIEEHSADLLTQIAGKLSTIPQDSEIVRSLRRPIKQILDSLHTEPHRFFDTVHALRQLRDFVPKLQGRIDAWTAVAEALRKIPDNLKKQGDLHSSIAENLDRAFAKSILSPNEKVELITNLCEGLGIRGFDYKQFENQCDYLQSAPPISPPQIPTSSPVVTTPNKQSVNPLRTSNRLKLVLRVSVLCAVLVVFGLGLALFNVPSLWQKPKIKTVAANAHVDYKFGKDSQPIWDTSLYHTDDDYAHDLEVYLSKTDEESNRRDDDTSKIEVIGTVVSFLYDPSYYDKNEREKDHVYFTVFDKTDNVRSEYSMTVTLKVIAEKDFQTIDLPINVDPAAGNGPFKFSASTLLNKVKTLVPNTSLTLVVEGIEVKDEKEEVDLESPAKFREFAFAVKDRYGAERKGKAEVYFNSPPSATPIDVSLAMSNTEGKLVELTGNQDNDIRRWDGNKFIDDTDKLQTIEFTKFRKDGADFADDLPFTLELASKSKPGDPAIDVVPHEGLTLANDPVIRIKPRADLNAEMPYGIYTCTYKVKDTFGADSREAEMRVRVYKAPRPVDLLNLSVKTGGSVNILKEDELALTEEDIQRITAVKLQTTTGEEGIDGIISDENEIGKLVVKSESGTLAGEYYFEFEGDHGHNEELTVAKIIITVMPTETTPVPTSEPKVDPEHTPKIVAILNEQPEKLKFYWAKKAFAKDAAGKTELVDVGEQFDQHFRLNVVYPKDLVESVVWHPTGLNKKNDLDLRTSDKKLGTFKIFAGDKNENSERDSRLIWTRENDVSDAIAKSLRSAVFWVTKSSSDRTGFFITTMLPKEFEKQYVECTNGKASVELPDSVLNDGGLRVYIRGLLIGNEFVPAKLIPDEAPAQVAFEHNGKVAGCAITIGDDHNLIFTVGRDLAPTAIVANVYREIEFKEGESQSEAKRVIYVPLFTSTYEGQAKNN